MNVILIGYRGTGKSEVGALLARRLGMSCIALDAAIVERAGTSIPQIVEQSGWDAFRDLESVLVAEVAMRDGVVVDTGGGVIERPANVPLLRRNGVVFWLRASVPTIVARIAGGTGRPPLTSGKTFTEEVEEVLERRTPKYRSAAHYEIDTDGLTPEKVADRIITLWRSHRADSAPSETGAG